MTWEEDGVAFHLVQTNERNLWRAVETATNKVAGLFLVYVDDLLVLGGTVRTQWTAEAHSVHVEDLTTGGGE